MPMSKDEKKKLEDALKGTKGLDKIAIEKAAEEKKRIAAVQSEKGWESYDPNRKQKIKEAVQTEKGWESYNPKPKGTQSGHAVTSGKNTTKPVK